MTARTALLALALCVLAAEPAAAGTVTSRAPVCGPQGTVCPVLVFDAAPGEANRVTLSRPRFGEIVIRDDGAPLTVVAGDRCRALGPNEAMCRADGARVSTGDLADTVASPGVALNADLGEGDDAAEGDTIAGGPGDDDLRGAHLDGGAGEDTLTAGPGIFRLLDGGSGADTITGGTGDDTLVAADVEGGPARDVIDGGGGNDTLSYLGHPHPVDVDLGRTGTQGLDGTEDVVANVTHALGGARDDVLRGDGRDNILYGSAGNDDLDGAGGADQLGGGSGFDRFTAGAGDDRIDAVNTYLRSDPLVTGVAPSADGLLDAEPEPVDCGAGRDAVTVDGDLVRPNCADGSPHILFPAIVRGSHARFRLRCEPQHRSPRSGRCPGRISLENLRFRGDPFTKRFSLTRRGGAVLVRLPVQMPESDRSTEHYLRVTIRRRNGYSGLPFTTRYTLWLPPGCRPFTRCGATAATP